MVAIFGFFIIGFFIGGIGMAVVYGIVDKNYENNSRYEVTVKDNKVNKYIAFRCDTAELVVNGIERAIKKLQRKTNDTDTISKD